jgi:SAM-dependent methyltransferase
VNWKYKALLQGVFSRLPHGERLNHLFQRYVTRSLPAPPATVWRIVEKAMRNHRAVGRYYEGGLGRARFYEFGAGWDLIIPMAYYSLGINDQTVVDIRPLARPDLVQATIDELMREGAARGLSRLPRPLSLCAADLAKALADQFGITYLAPCDARRTPLASGSIDCVTSTDTMEHLPLDDLEAVLRESFRLLRPGGLIVCQIGYEDHYSYFDGAISAYNFLQYSDRAWRLYNPALHYQSRLRHSDYRRLFGEAGFKILEEERTEPSVSDLMMLREIPLAARFSSYDRHDLGIREARFIAQKPVSVAPC